MVFADEGIEDISEVDVGVLVSGIDTAMLVVELNSAGNGLSQSETGGLGDNSGELVPLLLGNVLGNQAVLRLDVWEFSHFCFVLVQICLKDGLSCSKLRGRVPM